MLNPPFVAQAGGGLSMYLAKRGQPFTVVRFGMLPYLAASVGAAYLALNWRERAWNHFWAALVPCFPMIGMQFLVEPCARTLYLHDFKDVAGSAEGFCGLMQVFSMAAASALASLVYDDTPTYFYWALAATTALGNLFFWATLGLCPPDGAFLRTKLDIDDVAYDHLPAGADSDADATLA